MSKNNREEAQLLAIWKKALEAHPGHLELRFTHSSNATSIRLKLSPLKLHAEALKLFDTQAPL